MRQKPLTALVHRLCAGAELPHPRAVDKVFSLVRAKAERDEFHEKKKEFDHQRDVLMNVLDVGQLPCFIAWQDRCLQGVAQMAGDAFLWWIRPRHHRGRRRSWRVDVGKSRPSGHFRRIQSASRKIQSIMSETTASDALAIQFNVPGEAARLERAGRRARVEDMDLGRLQPLLLDRAAGVSNGIPALATPQVSAILRTWPDITVYSTQEQKDLLLAGMVEKAGRQLGLFRALLIMISALASFLGIWKARTIDSVLAV